MRVRMTKRIMVVDDDGLIRELVSIRIAAGGYQNIEAFDNASRALEYLHGHAFDVDLLITDVIMPGMSGPQLAEEIWKAKPSLKVIFMSGYIGTEKIPTGSTFLLKPFSMMELLKAIEQNLAD